MTRRTERRWPRSRSSCGAPPAGRADEPRARLPGGTLRREGPGQAFWFRAINAAIAEVPIDDRELPVPLPRSLGGLPGAHRAGRDHAPRRRSTARGAPDRLRDRPRLRSLDADAARAARRAGDAARAAVRDRRAGQARRAPDPRRRRGADPRPHRRGLAAEPALERPRDPGRRRSRGRGRANVRLEKALQQPTARGDPAGRRRGDVPAARAGGRGSGRSPRTSCRTGSSWPAARRTGRAARARTSASAPEDAAAALVAADERDALAATRQAATIDEVAGRAAARSRPSARGSTPRREPTSCSPSRPRAAGGSSTT